MKLWLQRKGHRTGRPGRGRPPLHYGGHHPGQQGTGVGAVLHGDTAEAPPVRTSPARIQPKLTVAAPQDACEQEADRMADRIVSGRGADGPGFLAAPEASAQRLCDECEEEEAPVQAKHDERSSPASTPGAGGAPDTAGGHPLPASLNRTFQSGFGRDLDPVRLHTDSRADRQAADIGARAFTWGRHIYFRHGEYRPAAPGGQWLLAHELTHVLQQDGAGTLRRVGSGESDSDTGTEE